MNERKNTETLEGYVVDIACLRKYPRAERLMRARAHTRECALMGHCLESGYGLVGENESLTLLDAEATLQVAGVLLQSDYERGIRLRVTRQKDDTKRTRVRVEKVSFE